MVTSLASVSVPDPKPELYGSRLADGRHRPEIGRGIVRVGAGAEDGDAREIVASIEQVEGLDQRLDAGAGAERERAAHPEAGRRERAALSHISRDELAVDDSSRSPPTGAAGRRRTAPGPSRDRTDRSAS